MTANELFRNRVDSGHCPICDKYILDGETDFKVVNDNRCGKVWICRHHKGV